MGRNKEVITSNVTIIEKELFKHLKFKDSSLTWSKIISRGIQSYKTQYENPSLNDVYDDLPIRFKELIRILYEELQELNLTFDKLLKNSGNLIKENEEKE